MVVLEQPQGPRTDSYTDDALSTIGFLGFTRILSCLSEEINCNRYLKRTVPYIDIKITQLSYPRT